MKKFVSLSLISILVLLHSCSKEDALRITKSSVPTLPSSSYNYYPTEQDKNDKATLGRVLFYERQMSKNNSVSCGSCHKQAFAFADNVAFSTGLNNVKTGRNSMPIQNLPNTDFIFFDNGSLPPNNGDFFAFSPKFFWDGRENNLSNLVLRPVTNHIEMGITDVSEIVDKIKQLPYYENLFNKAFGSNEITAAKISEAVAVFMLSIQSNESKFDKFIMNGESGLNALELSGYNLFNGTYNCASCHNPFPGPYMADEPKDIGLDRTITDRGFGVISGKSSEMGKFKVPNLKNVALTAPYMHDGRFKTLDEVLEHYSNGIQRSPNLSPFLMNPNGTAMQLNIKQEDKVALIAFLNSMTDYSLITDPKFSDPFQN
jgi:cytochrome c peroxidase